MRILFVEDDLRASSFVIKGLRQAGYSVDHTPSGEEGLELALTRSFDAGIIDVMLPGMDGLDLIVELRRRHSLLPLIILSARGSLRDRIKGFETGGDDYLTKPFAFAELLARLQALIRRSQGRAEPSRLTVGDLSLDIYKRQVVRNNRKIDLQPREFALLEYLMQNAGRVVSKTMIMEHVWDYNFDPHTNVVEARICRLREKIDRQAGPKLIHTIRGVGYVIKESD